jgi:hypothetical protein
VNFVKVAEIAAEQNGRITTRQLRTCGFGNSSIENAREAGHLHREHHGVYVVGHRAPSRTGRWHGAVLAAGSDAVLSHRCAATAWGIRDGVGPRIDVTTPPGGRKRPGIAFHRAALEPFEMTTWRKIPITTPSRTMVDLAHELRDEEVIEWALRRLQLIKRYDHKLLELSNHRRRNAVLGRLLGGIAPTRSPLEIAFLTRVVRPHLLPAPEVNSRPEGFMVDFLWPDAYLIVETDGSQHDDPLQRRADEIRDAYHAERGYLTLRYRWPDVDAGAGTAAQIRALLDARADFHPGSG